MIPDKSKTLNEGAIEPWTKPKYRPLFTELKRFARQAEIPLDVPWDELDPEQQRLVIEGEGKLPGSARLLQPSGTQEVQAACARISEPLSRIFACAPTCNGARLRIGSAAGEDQRQEYLRRLQHDGGRGGEFFESVRTDAEQEAGIAEKLLQEIRERLRFLNEVGLEYLTLDRLVVHAVGRRSAAHSAGNFAGLAAGGNAVCAR